MLLAAQARVYDGLARQCDRMEHGRLDVVPPPLGEMSPWWLRFGEHCGIQKEMLEGS